MANRLGGKVSLDDEHEEVDDFIEHGGVKVAGAQGEEELADDVCEVRARQSPREKHRSRTTLTHLRQAA